MIQIILQHYFENSIRKDFRFFIQGILHDFGAKLLGILCLRNYERAKTGRRSPFYLNCSHLLVHMVQLKRLLMKIPGNQPTFYLWPIQKHLHLGVPERVQSNVQLNELGKRLLDNSLVGFLYPTIQAIPAIYGRSALYMVVMQRVGSFPGKSIASIWSSQLHLLL